jgi:hypothetical protein
VHDSDWTATFIEASTMRRGGGPGMVLKPERCSPRSSRSTPIVGACWRCRRRAPLEQAAIAQLATEAP